MQPIQLTFIHHSPSTQGSRSTAIQNINSHVATHTHAARRHQDLLEKNRLARGRLGSYKRRSDTNSPRWGGPFPPAWHAAVPNLRQIHSSLDPFISLPLNLSKSERMLLQSYLTVDRHFFVGTSQNPAFCPSLEAAKLLLPICPVYILTHIVASCILHSLRTGNKFPAIYYQRRANAYKAMNELLSRPDVPLDRRLFSLINLAVMEAFAGCHSLRKMHVVTMDRFAESKGGLAILFQEPGYGGRLLDPVYYASAYIDVDFGMLSWEAFQMSQQRLVQLLEGVGTWSMVMQSKSALVDDRAREANRILLSPIISYTSYLLDSLAEGQGATSYQAAAYFFFGIVLCTILLEGNHDAAATVQLLHRSQQCMQSSTCSSCPGSVDLWELKPQPAAKLINHVRRLMTTEDGLSPLDEVIIGQAAIDAQEAFIFVPNVARRELTMKLAQCVFTLVDPVDESPFNAQYLDRLQQAMSASWETRHQYHT